MMQDSRRKARDNAHRPGLPRLLAALALLTLAACQPDAPPRPEGSTDLSAAERAACLAEGGTVGRGGMLASEQCFKPLPDAGKSCSTAKDCSGLCMADTGTCQAVTPQFGCLEFLDETGQKVGLCVD